jgi:hypothetical protein
MSYLATLYKARVPHKQPVCAICIDRTRGKTSVHDLGYGVRVWLCADHGSAEFQRQRAGRDFYATLFGIWKANGCMTATRRRALDAHMARLSDRPQRSRPGSYAWPKLRLAAEAAFGNGHSAPTVAAFHQTRLADCEARAPSLRTFRRWKAQRRWVSPRGDPVRLAP